MRMSYSEITRNHNKSITICFDRGYNDLNTGGETTSKTCSPCMGTKTKQINFI